MTDNVLNVEFFDWIKLRWGTEISILFALLM